MFDVQLVYHSLKLEDIYENVVSNDCGAVSLFVGTTRNTFENRPVTRLIYESYYDMALKCMRQICEEIKNKWHDVKNVIIHHRLGEVPVGESSIIIAVSSPHRQDALEAVHFAIDRIKAFVPIFKKEEYGNGEAQWKENEECCWSKMH